MPGVLLPPGFVAVVCDGDPVAEAVRRAENGAEPGTVLCAPLAARCWFGIVLTPDRPVADRVILAMAAQAAHDALAGLAPAGVPVVVGDGCILVNSGEAATIGVRRSPVDADGVPAWLVLGIDVAVDLGDPDPGRDVLHTCLAEEGFTCSAEEVLGATCRHLLAGIDAMTERKELV